MNQFIFQSQYRSKCSLSGFPYYLQRLLKFFLLIQVVLLNITVGDKLIIEQTDELLSEAPEDTDYTPPERIKVKFNLLNLFF